REARMLSRTWGAASRMSRQYKAQIRGGQGEGEEDAGDGQKRQDGPGDNGPAPACPKGRPAWGVIGGGGALGGGEETAKPRRGVRAVNLRPLADPVRRSDLHSQKTQLRRKLFDTSIAGSPGRRRGCGSDHS